MWVAGPTPRALTKLFSFDFNRADASVTPAFLQMPWEPGGKNVDVYGINSTILLNVVNGTRARLKNEDAFIT